MLRSRHSKILFPCYQSYKSAAWISGLEKRIGGASFVKAIPHQNLSKFKIGQLSIPKEVQRTDIRLTVDYPDDLVFCRFIYVKFKNYSPRIPLVEIIKYIDLNPKMKELVDPFVDEGLKTMYI